MEKCLNVSANMIMDDAYYGFSETGGCIWGLESLYQFVTLQLIAFDAFLIKQDCFLSLHFIFWQVTSKERFLCLSVEMRVSQSSTEDSKFCCVLMGNAFQSCPISSVPQHFFWVFVFFILTERRKLNSTIIFCCGFVLSDQPCWSLGFNFQKNYRVDIEKFLQDEII